MSGGLESPGLRIGVDHPLGGTEHVRHPLPLIDQNGRIGVTEQDEGICIDSTRCSPVIPRGNYQDFYTRAGPEVGTDRAHRNQTAPS
jgi:hypothetical protein